MVRKPEVPQSCKRTRDGSSIGENFHLATGSIIPDDILSAGLSSGASIIGGRATNTRSAHKKIMTYRPPTGTSMSHAVRAITNK